MCHIFKPMIFMRYFSKTILAIGSVKVFATQIITEGFRKAILFLTPKDAFTLLFEVAVIRFVSHFVFGDSSPQWATSGRLPLRMLVGHGKMYLLLVVSSFLSDPDR
jgi:hypothetical protein